MQKKTTHRTKFRAEYPADYNFDFKDPLTMSRFVTDGGKIVPARISKLSYAQQKLVARAVKRARSMALVPSGMIAYDDYMHVEPISPKPFSID